MHAKFIILSNCKICFKLGSIVDMDTQCWGGLQCFPDMSINMSERVFDVVLFYKCSPKVTSLCLYFILIILIFFNCIRMCVCPKMSCLGALHVPSQTPMSPCQVIWVDSRVDK